MTQPVSRDSAFPSPLSSVPPGPPPPPAPSPSPFPLGVDVLQTLPDASPTTALRLTPRVVGDVGGAGGSDVGATLDAFLASAKPTFRTNEGPVSVPIGFYMAGSPVDAGYGAQLNQALAQVGITAPDKALLLAGKGTPELVAKATQAMIDAGHLPTSTTTGDTSLAGRVRELMFKSGLGLDCAGYVIGAVANVRGVSPAAAGFTIQNDGLYALGARGYGTVPAGASLQAGDIVCLHGATGRPPDEHRAVVRDCQPLPQSVLQTTGLLSKDFVAAHASDSWESVEVDSSWGNYGNPQEGGVSRQTWWHDLTAGTWVSTQRGQVLTGTVPYGHTSYEVFRARGAK